MLILTERNPAAKADPDRRTPSAVSTRLLDEAEREAARERKTEPRPRPSAANRPAPRPFAFD